MAHEFPKSKTARWHARSCNDRYEHELVNHSAHGSGPDTTDHTIWKNGEAY